MRSQTRTFGSTALGFKPFTRACEKLKTEAGRKHIVAWIKDTQLNKEKHFGMADLKSVVEELQKMKAGSNRSLDQAAAGSVGAGAYDNPLGHCQKDFFKNAGSAFFMFSVTASCIFE